MEGCSEGHTETLEFAHHQRNRHSETLAEPLRPVPIHILLQQREGTGIRLNRSQLNHHPRFKLAVPFSSLETSSSEAVLGLDSEGQYAVALADTDCGLALKFYGVPSRDKLERRRMRRLTCIAPLLQTVCLRVPKQDGFHQVARVANVSVQIVTSSDWKIGVAIIHDAKNRYETQDDGDLGNLVLFEFPSSTAPDASIPMLSSLICPNVRIGGHDDFTIRNRLWKTKCIPVHRQHSNTSSIATHTTDQAGYLFLHDEDDGFRLSWIVSNCQTEKNLKLLSDSTMPKQSSRDDIVTRVIDSSWEPSDPIVAPSVHVAMEAYLHVDALLDEIRSMRKDVFHYNDLKYPDFYYRLISVEPSGRVALIVVVFSNQVQRRHIAKRARQFPTSVGVFLQVDLFTQAYREIEWGQCSYKLDTGSLRGWASLLALNRRMKDQHLGPFCLENPVKRIECNDWTPFLVEENMGREPSSPVIWNRYLKDLKSSKMKPISPPKIPYSMLYPDADVLSNQAVRRGIPVSSLICRSGVTELVYK